MYGGGSGVRVERVAKSSGYSEGGAAAAVAGPAKYCSPRQI